MAPHLVRAHGVVGAHVEACARVVGPGESVGDVVDDVGEIFAGRRSRNRKRVPLAAVEVDGVCEIAMIGGDLESTEGEIVVTDGEDVSRRARSARSRGPAPRPSAVDRVLRAFFGPGGVLPRALGDGCRLVGLLDARLDLVEDPFAQRQRREHRVGVAVLGLEVGDDLGIVPVAEPIPVVPRASPCASGRGACAGRRRRPAIDVLLGSRHCRLSLNGAGRRRRDPLRFRPHAARDDADPVHGRGDRRRRASTPTASSRPIVQEEGTNQVLMVAWMNRGALVRTLETGRTWFWSRSRREYWCKGKPPATGSTCDPVLRLRRRRAALRRRSRRVGAPVTRASTAASSELRQRRDTRASVTVAAVRPSREEFRALARLHGRAGVAGGAGRFRDAAVGIREAGGRSRRVPARVGRARRTLGAVLLSRSRSGRTFVGAVATSSGSEVLHPTTCPTIRERWRCSKRCWNGSAPTLPELPPFHGGIVGWMGYDTVREIEHLPSPPPTISASPTRCARSPAASPRSTISVSACTSSRTSTRRPGPTKPRSTPFMTAIAARERGRRSRQTVAVRSGDPRLADVLDELPEIGRNFSAGAWADAVNAAKEHILEGDIFQVVLAQRFDLVEPVRRSTCTGCCGSSTRRRTCTT